jgi:hypothetical protein
MFVRYGLGDDLQVQITKYQQALHGLAVAINAAKASGQDAAAEQLRTQFDALTAETNALVAKQRGVEMPSPLALSLANMGDTLAKNARTFSIVAGLGIVALLVGPALLRRRQS